MFHSRCFLSLLVLLDNPATVLGARSPRGNETGLCCDLAIVCCPLGATQLPTPGLPVGLLPLLWETSQEKLVTGPLQKTSRIKPHP